MNTADNNRSCPRTKRSCGTDVGLNLDSNVDPLRRRLRRPPRDGIFLLMVLVIVAVATLAVYSFTETMIVMDDAAHLEAGTIQSRMSVESSEAMLQVFLAATAEEQNAAGGLYNNPNVFAAQPVAPQANSPGEEAFTILASSIDPMGRLAGIRYGLVDQSGRLNINTLTVLDENSDVVMPALQAISQDVADQDIENLAVSLLMALPGMTLEIADAILDWIDEDDEPRELGAESETYAILQQPYQPANGPITSVDELLLVRGVTASLMFGADANRNGVLDAAEQQRFGVTIDTPGALGWASMLTTRSLESNLSPDGNPRVDINGDDLEDVFEQLSAAIENPDFASFIVAYRVAGEQSGSFAADTISQDNDAQVQIGDLGVSSTDGGIWTADQIGNVDLTGGGQPIQQILDLVGASVSIQDNGRTVTYQSPFVNDPAAASLYLPDLMDRITAAGPDPLPGRLSINTCPVELLAGIPTLTSEQVDAILQTRDPGSLDPATRHATWLWTEGIVDLAQMRLLMPIVCGGGDIFQAQCVGYRVTGGAFSRWEIILDASEPMPQIISRRNLSHLGRGFDLSVLGSSAAVAN